MKICICDIDGVVADSTARFKRAEEAKQAYLTSPAKLRDGFSADEKAKALYWQMAFTPELVALDTLIEGAVDALAILATNSGYEVLLLTSRPESMREATRQWLFEQECPVGVPLIMKSPAFQYTKTPVWKAGMVQTLAALYEATEVLFIDDEEANWDELVKYEDARAGHYSLEWFKSLDEAVKVEENFG